MKDRLGNTRAMVKQDGSIMQVQDYYAFGLEMNANNQVTPSPNNQYKYNGKEWNTESGLDAYDYGARFYDPVIGRWNVVDPLAEKFGSYSPYNYGLNNPMIMIDPDGRAASPIYDENGRLLGTDDQGLKGKAIVMNQDKFKQGMSHEDALDNNLGVAGLKDSKAKSNLSNSYNKLSTRPDYDGQVTLDEATKWYRGGSGQSLYADLGKIDFSTTFESDVAYRADGESGYVNLFLTQSPKSQLSGGGGLVYGSMLIQIGQNQRVSSPANYQDIYDFDIKPWTLNVSRAARNIGAHIGQWKAGQGTTFGISFYGTNKLATPRAIK